MCLLVLFVLGLSSGLTLALHPGTSVKDLDAAWDDFRKTYNKVYPDADTERFRRATWEYHLDVIEKFNMEADLGLHTYRLGINKFADIGQCGACWAFSATGSLEGQWFKKTGELISLSEQNLMDCSKDEGNLGCLGGRMDWAYNYIRKNDGVDTEASYPYEGQDNLPCRFTEADVGATTTGFVFIDVGDEEGQKAAVAEVGPIAIAMDASRLTFQLYKSGVYYDAACSSVLLNHAVLAIGYGTTSDGDDYWLMKNSWGTQWGDEGYFKMARNRDNNCGIATDSLYPTV
nr:hypothetical protein BaRGS_000017 [Batillaria attramentaria]